MSESGETNTTIPDILLEQQEEEARMHYHMNKDSGMWLDSKTLVNESNKLNCNSGYLFDFMCEYVVNNDDFLSSVDGVHFISDNRDKAIRLTGTEARHFIENYRMPVELPYNNLLYSMFYGRPDTTAYNVYIYVYLKDSIIDFSNQWRNSNPMDMFTIIPRNP